jgi:hypothetical protein
LASGDQLNSHDLLLAAVDSLPIPGAPPRLERAGAWIGLSFLETALRQNHVRRFTEALYLAEHGAAERTVRIDIRLSLLHPRQIEAGLLYSALRARLGGSEDDASDTGETVSAPQRWVSRLLGRDGANSPLVWVPIARLSRRSTTPVEVLDGVGTGVPTLTQHETARLLAPGLYRLLWAILRSDTRASVVDSEVDQLLHKDERARWLLQQAILTLFEERAAPTTRSMTPAPASDGRWTGSRNTVRAVLEQRRLLLSSFEELLNYALHEYLIVAGLPNSKDEHHLRYTTPLEAERRWRLRDRVAQHVGQVNPIRRTYRVLYSTSLSSTLPAYHVVAQTEPGLDVDHMILTGGADRARTRRLRADLCHLADQLEQRRTAGWGKSDQNLLELEFGSCLLEISQLVRRRRWEAEHAGGEVRPSLRALSELTGVAMTDAGDHDGQQRPRRPLLRHPKVTAELLRAAARELDDFEVAKDLSTENDPKASRAHAYWRQAPVHRVLATTIDAECSIVIGDAPIDSSRRIAVFAASVLVMTYLLGVFIYDELRPWAWSGDINRIREPEAVIGILLLVPGFMYSRLDLPSMNLIVARLRLFPRLVAYLSIASAALLAGYVATKPSTDHLRWGFSWALAAQALAVLALLPRAVAGLLGSWRHHAAKIPGTPRWYRPRRRMDVTDRPPRARYEARFRTVGSKPPEEGVHDA